MLCYFNSWSTQWASLCHDIWMCVVYNIWPRCSNRIISVLSTFYVCVSVGGVCPLDHSTCSRVSSLYVRTADEQCEPGYKDNRYLHMWNDALSWLCSESDWSVLSLFSDIRVNSANELLKKQQQLTGISFQWRKQWVYSKFFLYLLFSLNCAWGFDINTIDVCGRRTVRKHYVRICLLAMDIIISGNTFKSNMPA